MGYVKDWGNMLEGFFKEMFFEVEWMFLPEEDLPVQSMIYSGDKKRDAVEDVALWVRRREVLWEKNEESHVWEEKRLKGLPRLSSAMENGKSFDGREFFAWESLMEEVRAQDAFNKNESGWAYGIEEFKSGGYEVESFEKMLAGEDLYTDKMEAFFKNVAYDNSGDYGSVMDEEVAVMEREYGRDADEREKISLKRENREKLLSPFEKEEHGRSHEIKIEMVRHESERNELDMDETLDRLTERLCNLMAKGADGFYL